MTCTGTTELAIREDMSFLDTPELKQKIEAMLDDLFQAWHTQDPRIPTRDGIELVGWRRADRHGKYQASGQLVLDKRLLVPGEYIQFVYHYSSGI